MPRGVYLRTEETRKKMSERLKGYKLSEKTKMKMSKSRRGEGNSMFGRHHSKEAKLKMRKAKIGKKLSEKHKRKMLEKKKGERSHFWLGGISFEPYGVEFNKELKEKIRRRDNYSCQVPRCKNIQNGKKFPVHHIDYDKKNNDELNLTTLCFFCHAKTNANRQYWQTLLRAE